MTGSKEGLKMAIFMQVFCLRKISWFYKNTCICNAVDIKQGKSNFLILFSNEMIFATTGSRVLTKRESGCVRFCLCFQLMTKEAPAGKEEGHSEVMDQLKKTVEEMNKVVEEKDELAQRCHELDQQVSDQ